MVGGYWRDVSSIKIFVNDQWRTLTALKIEVGNTWHDAWSSSSLQAFSAYNCGGYTPCTAVISKLLFSNESCANISATLSSARYSTAPVYSLLAGYLAGGQLATPITNVIDKLTYLSETRSVLSATLSGNRRDAGGVSSPAKGYFMGGYDGVSRLNIVQALTFSNETMATLSGTIYNKSHCIGFQSTIKGYVTGGYNGVALNNISFVSFSTEVMGTVSTGLVTARYSHFAVFSATKGYSGAGMPALSSVEALTFSNDTVGSVAASCTCSGPGSGDSLTKGYVIAGQYSTNIWALVFSTESLATISARNPTGLAYSDAVNYWNGSR